MPSAASTPLMYSAARASFPGGLLVLIFTSSTRNFRASSWALLKSGVDCCAKTAAPKSRTVNTARKMVRIIASQLRTSSKFMQEVLDREIVGDPPQAATGRVIG